MPPRQVKRIWSHHGRAAGLGRDRSGSVGLRRLPACDTCTTYCTMTHNSGSIRMRAAGEKVAWVVRYGGKEVEGGVKGWERWERGEGRVGGTQWREEG